MGKKAAYGAAKRKRRANKIRAWRKARGRTLVDLGAEVGKSHASLSRIERSTEPQGYTEDLLEALAEALGAPSAVDLLIRSPDDPEGIWAVWDAATASERVAIIELAKALRKSRQSNQ